MKNRTFGYSLIQGFFWMCFAVIMGFASPYLKQAGFEDGAVGLILAAGGLLSALIQPVVAGYADRPGSMSLRGIVASIAGFAAVGAGGLLLLRGQMWATGVCYALVIVLLQLTTPLVNSLGVQTENSGEAMNFGIARGMGSLGYAVTAYLLGALTDRFGAGLVPGCMAGAFVLFLLSIWGYRPIAERKVPQTKSGQNLLKKYPRYLFVLAGCAMLFISHSVLNNFSYQITVSKGGGTGEMGAAMALAGIIELPPMFLFGWMLRKKRCDFWFRISGIFFMLKCLGTLLCTTIPGFYGVQVFQMAGWALISVSSVYYINSIMAPEDTVKGQAWYTVALTLGNVVGPMAAGQILDSLDVNAMLIFGTVCAFVGAGILLFGTEKTA